jgi:hypothetical protein
MCPGLQSQKACFMLPQGMGMCLCRDAEPLGMRLLWPESFLRVGSRFLPYAGMCLGREDAKFRFSGCPNTNTIVVGMCQHRKWSPVRGDELPRASEDVPGATRHACGNDRFPRMGWDVPLGQPPNLAQMPSSL